jgi:DNA-binding NtrC family response regulator
VALGLGRQEIDASDLPSEMLSPHPPTSTPLVELPDDGIDLPGYLDSIERVLVKRALERTGGNRNKAADLLRLKRTTLVEKLKRIGATH